MINMVQEFEAVMVEEEDTGEQDAKDEEEFEIEVLFDLTKFEKHYSSGQDSMDDKEDNYVFSVDVVFAMIQ